jgi:hypothetical protein
MFTLPGGWNEPVVLSEFPLLSISEKSVIETLNHIFLHCSWLFCIFLRWNSACIFRCWKDSTQQSWGQVLKKSQHIKVGGGEWGEPSFQGRKCFPKSDSKTELSGFLGFSQFSLKAFFHLTATIFSAFTDCPDSVFPILLQVSSLTSHQRRLWWDFLCGVCVCVGGGIVYSCLDHFLHW